MAAKNVQKQPKFDERGMAVLETLALLVIFVVLIAFSLGCFGIIHTAILHSIHARTYAFETFRHRTNLTYFRDNRLDQGVATHYRGSRVRMHGIQSDVNSADRGNSGFFATERSISMGMPMTSAIANRDGDNAVRQTQIFQRIAPGRRTQLRLNPVWIRVMYGICLDVNCGDR